MRNGATYRAVRKALDGEQFKPMEQKIGPGRTNKWLQRHPKLAPYYGIAVRVLKNGERAQQPTWRSIRKMMVALAISPKVTLPGVGVVPYQLSLGRWERGSWRSYPHVAIDSNLTARLS